MKKVNTVTIILISVIVVLSGILVYGIYSELKMKATINSMQMENQQLNAQNDNLATQLDILQGKYDLLEQDIAKIYKGCIKENICKGHFPGVSWYCNNVGDGVDTNPSHVCICDSSCNLNATPINQ